MTESPRPRRDRADAAVGLVPGREFTAETHPFVSVVIPVYDDLDALSVCLDRLERQTYPSHCFEVIVVDNGSTHDPGRVTGNRRGVTLLRCLTPGSYAARNCGVAAARGTVLAFTDADCLPRADWLEKGIAALRQNPDVSALGGAVQITGSRGSGVELHQRLWALSQQRYLEQSRFLATANVFTYKLVFESVGRFDERLLSSGDWEWCRRAHAKGHRMAFRADVIVLHPPLATLRSLLCRQRRVVGGQFAVRRLCGAGHAAAVVDMFRRPLRRTFGKDRPAHLSWPDRARVAVVEWALAATRLLEFVRLLLGGAPRRR